MRFGPSTFARSVYVWCGSYATVVLFLAPRNRPRLEPLYVLVYHPAMSAKDRWDLVRKTCDEHPGTWVLVTDQGHGSWPNQVKNARLSAFKPAGTYEAMMRNGNGLIGQIFVRRIPTPKEEQK